MYLIKLLLLICMVITSSFIQTSQGQGCYGQGVNCEAAPHKCCPGYQCKQLKFQAPKVCAVYGGGR